LDNRLGQKALLVEYFHLYQSLSAQMVFQLKMV